MMERKYRPCFSAGRMLLLCLLITCSFASISYCIHNQKEFRQTDSRIVKNKELQNNALSLDYACINKASTYEDNTIHIFIKNRSTVPVELKELVLNGKKLPFYNSQADLVSSRDSVTLPNREYIWTQIYPNPIPAGGVSDIMIKPTQCLRFSVKAALTFDNNQKIETVIRPQFIKAKLKYVGFSADLKKIYIYVYNCDEKPLVVKSLYINNSDMLKNCKFLPERIRPDSMGCIIASLEDALQKGDFVPIKIITNGPILETVSRALSFFPIRSWGGDTRNELNLDPEPFLLNYSDSSELNKANKEKSSSVAYLFGDPVCNDHKSGKPIGSNAMEIIRRGIIITQKYPHIPTFTHICEYDKKNAYRIYGKTVDIAGINPYEVMIRKGTPKGNEYYTALGKISVEPRMLVTIPEAYHGGIRFPTPEEVRLTTYYELSKGSKGIIYYTDGGKAGYKNNPKLEKEIKQINKELQVLKEFLKIGEPCSLASSNDERVSANTILAGDLGIVLIVINNDYENNFDAKKREYFKYNPKTNIRVTVDIPKYLAISKAYSIGNELKDIEFQKIGEQLVIEIDRLNLTEQILLLTGSEEANEMILDAQWDWNLEF